MNDGGEIIHSTRLPGASPITASVSIAGRVPRPQQSLAPQPPEEEPADYVDYERHPDDLSSVHIPLPPFARDRDQLGHLVLLVRVRFGVSVVRHRSDCGCPIFVAFCFARMTMTTPRVFEL
jgi:hypothetical protein